MGDFTKLFFAILLLSLIVSCDDVQRECADYKTGDFYYTQKINDTVERSSFTRNDTLEISTYRGIKDTATIYWINPCEYILKELSPKNMTEKKSIHFRIISTTKDSCFVRYNLVGHTDNIQSGVITKQ